MVISEEEEKNIHIENDKSNRSIQDVDSSLTTFVPSSGHFGEQWYLQ